MLDIMREKTQEKIEWLADDFPGVMGVYAADPSDPENALGVNEDVVFPTASSIKITILAEFFRKAEAGLIDPMGPLTLRGESVVPGSGVLKELHPGEVAMPLIDFATLMVTVSDNTATNIMIDLAGIDDVNKLIKSLGLEETSLQRKMFDWEGAAAGRENLSTPREMAGLMERLHSRRGLSEYVCENTIEIMKKPKENPIGIREGLPEGIPVANKAGWMAGVMCDAGIVYLSNKPYVVAINMAHIPASDFRGFDAEAAFREIVKVIHDHFEETSLSSEYGRRY
jgi:beta-lactamase class A